VVSSTVVSGQRPIQEFRDFQVEISRMGIQRAHEILTEAQNKLQRRRIKHLIRLI